jgi:hypothetical protein
MDLLFPPALVTHDNCLAEASVDHFHDRGLGDGRVGDESDATPRQIRVQKPVLEQEYEILHGDLPLGHRLFQSGGFELQNHPMVPVVSVGKLFERQGAMRVNPSIDERVIGKRFLKLGNPLSTEAGTDLKIQLVTGQANVRDEVRAVMGSQGEALPLKALVVSAAHQLIDPEGLFSSKLCHEYTPGGESGRPP